MIIRDLEHQEIISQRGKIEGGLASVNVILTFLALGSQVSIAQVPRANFLATETPGLNIASGELEVVLIAAGSNEVSVDLVA